MLAGIFTLLKCIKLYLTARINNELFCVYYHTKLPILHYQTLEGVCMNAAKSTRLVLNKNKSGKFDPSRAIKPK